MFKDDKLTKYYSFDNCFVRINKTEIKIFKSKFKAIYQATPQNSFQHTFFYFKAPGIYEKFINHITGNDPDRKKILMEMIGYLSHDYLSECNKIIIISDTINPKNEFPPSRTGKSLIVKAIETVLKSSFDFNTHAFLRLDAKFFKKYIFNDNDHNGISLIHVDDVYSKFNLENLFILLECHKFIITSNHPYTLQGISTTIRTKQFQIDNYYDHNITPVKEFKRFFFNGFTKRDWDCFFSFMIRCSKVFFDNSKPYLFDRENINYENQQV